MKHLLVLLLVALTLSPAQGQLRPLHKKKHNVNRLLEEVKAAPDFRTAAFAFLAVDLESGEVLASHNPDMTLRPASTLKLLSTASVLELLGPEHRFVTTLQYNTRASGSGKAIFNNIYIRGGGDPTLGSAHFPDSVRGDFLAQWVAAIRGRGLDSLAGRIIGDASHFDESLVPPTWSWQNMGQYYGAGPCGLSIYDNQYSLYLNTGAHVGDTAVLSKVVPPLPLELDCRVTSDSITWDNSYIFGAPYSMERSITGTLPPGRKDFRVRGSMPDPAMVAAAELDAALLNAGWQSGAAPTTTRLLRIAGELPAEERFTLHRHFSPSLQDIITKTNVHSINHFAEHCLLHAGIWLGARPETEEAADSVLAYWERKGMNVEGLSMHDGSGLTQYNAISPRQLVWLLTYMSMESQYAEEYYNSMAIAGVSGTLKPLFKGSMAEGKLRAKSGTISRAKAYAGYVTTQSGRKVAFSMVANGFSGSSRQARAKLEQLMIALAEFNK